jgi:carboxyl-terminal processing protease
MKHRLFSFLTVTGKSFRHPVLALALFLLVAGLGFSGCAGLLSESGNFQLSDSAKLKTPLAAQARQIYAEAWASLKQDFMDPTMNGQDWPRWRHRYDNEMETPQDAYVAVETMVASLNDDYTRYLPPRDMSEQSLYIDSRLFGVGLQISVKDSKLMVVAPIDDTPAAHAGLKPNDVITHIDGHSAAGLPVEEAADKIRGPEGSQVRLTVKRGDGKPFTVALTRQEIKIKSVFTQEIEPKSLGYVRLNSFISETAVDEMRAALDKLKDKKAIILDIRGNYGGLLSNAIEISDMFLDNGTIVSVRGRNTAENRTFTARSGQATRKPMVLLIDGGSASASEILSGALQDHHRATLIGAKTFGKGLVQKITPIQEDGSGLNITISRYLTPKGVDINKKGIQPDIPVSLTEADVVAVNDKQLKAAIEYLNEQVHLAEKNKRLQPIALQKS